MPLRKFPIYYIFHKKQIYLKQLIPLDLQIRNFHRNITENSARDREFPYLDIPRPGKKWERKPYTIPMKVLIKRAKEEKRIRKENPCRLLEHPPDNGLPVPNLIEVAHKVYKAREVFVSGLAKLLHGASAISVQRCRFCSEIHIGQVGHEIRTCEGPGCGARNSTHVWIKGGLRDILGLPFCYHLYDRVGKPRVIHKEKFQIPRLPAISELCIQAGVDVNEYPAKRRIRPVYSIEGRIVDFEEKQENKEKEEQQEETNVPTIHSSPQQLINLDMLTRSELSTVTLNSWLEMRLGAVRLMKKYTIWTCGYCPEVQVGPKGHKVRNCKATKHQQRDGQHAWQQATIDDLIRPSHVWHVGDANGPPLTNELKRYYGKAPAVVEVCVHAGAEVPKEFRSMMRLDVVSPDRDEFDLVA